MMRFFPEVSPSSGWSDRSRGRGDGEAGVGWVRRGRNALASARIPSRRCEHGDAIRSVACRVLDCFAALAMTRGGRGLRHHRWRRHPSASPAEAGVQLGKVCLDLRRPSPTGPRPSPGRGYWLNDAVFSGGFARVGVVCGIKRTGRWRSRRRTGAAVAAPPAGPACSTDHLFSAP